MILILSKYFPNLRKLSISNNWLTKAVTIAETAGFGSGYNYNNFNKNKNKNILSLLKKLKL